MNKSLIEYISIKYIIQTFSNSNKRIDSISYKNIINYLENVKVNNKKLIIFDMDGIEQSIEIIDSSSPKKSALYFSFKEFFEKNKSKVCLFINCSDIVLDQIKERDFIDYTNNYLLRDSSPYDLINCGNKKESDLLDFFTKELSLIETDLAFIKDRNKLNDFKFDLIGNKIRSYISEKCVSETSKTDHILKSTSVHVNKYINLKPLLENFNSFSEICFYLNENIRFRMREIPDFLVVPSKNAQVIASGLIRFLPSDILIINQVSPITSYNNFSTLNKIDKNAKYAIVEDFHCMGTEIKVIKGILWSHGVNLDEKIYTFPIASTNIYDDDNIGLAQNKIFPLYKLEKDFDYKIFTQTTCPVCNDIKCEHRKSFSI